MSQTNGVLEDGSLLQNIFQNPILILYILKELLTKSWFFWILLGFVYWYYPAKDAELLLGALIPFYVLSSTRSYEFNKRFKKIEDRVEGIEGNVNKMAVNVDSFMKKAIKTFEDGNKGIAEDRKTYNDMLLEHEKKLNRHEIKIDNLEKS